MPTMVFELHVELDEGAPYDVVADQRDIARFEVQPFGWPIQELEARPVMTFFRYLAWSASVRQQLTTAAWDEWNEHCIEVFPPDDETTDEDTAPDPLESPGAKAPSAARTSRSRSRAAKT